MMTVSYNTKTKQKAWLVLGLLALCQPVVAGSASAQSSRDVNTRLTRVENEVETLSRAVYRGDKAPPSGGLVTEGSSSNADTQVRIQQLEIEIRDLRGMLEQQNHEITSMREHLDRSLSDAELRFQAIERGAGSSSAAATTTPAADISATSSSSNAASSSSDAGTSSTTKGDGFSWSSKSNEGADASATTSTSGRLGTLSTSPSAGDTAAQAYDKAFALLQGNKYDEAGKEFEAFLSKHKDHTLAGNAKYWLGESYYVRGDYQKAARVFAEGYKEYPKNSKAADNLLKLGMSLSALGKKDDACIALSQLKKNYATDAASVVRRAEQEVSRLGCGA
jgi:tol-pal system protein YbgF